MLGFFVRGAVSIEHIKYPDSGKSPQWPAPDGLPSLQQLHPPDPPPRLLPRTPSPSAPLLPRVSLQPPHPQTSAQTTNNTTTTRADPLPAGGGEWYPLEGESHHVDHNPGALGYLGPRHHTPTTPISSSNIRQSVNPSQSTSGSGRSQDSGATTTQGVSTDDHTEFIKAVFKYVDRWVERPRSCNDKDDTFCYIFSDEPQIAVDMIYGVCPAPLTVAKPGG